MRKSINDSKALALKHLATIYQLTGVEFEYEVDWVEVAAKTATSSYGRKEKIGELVHDTYLESFAKRLVNFVKEPVYKSAFAELCGERKMLAFKIHDEERGRDDHWITFENGVLVINVAKHWYGNRTNDVGANLVEALSVGGLSLAARKNIYEYLTTGEKFLSIIEGATGIAFEVEVDWELISRQYKARNDIPGEIVYDWYLGGLAKRVASTCANPVMKDAFVDCFGERKTITFKIHDEVPQNHRHQKVWTSNENGVLTINFENLEARSEWGKDLCGNDLKESCSQGELCLDARLDIYETEPARVKILERVLATTGVQFDVEVDWKIWKLASDRLFLNRPGTAVNKYLDAFATHLAKLCEDEMCKEAFVDATSAKQIHFRILPQEELGHPNSVDCTCTFTDDGVLNINSSTENCGKWIDGCGADLIKNL